MMKQNHDFHERADELAAAILNDPQHAVPVEYRAIVYQRVFQVTHIDHIFTTIMFDGRKFTGKHIVAALKAMESLRRQMPHP